MISDKPVILCVDDEENPLILRKLVLEKAGYEVVTSTSARSAVEIVSSRHVDLVLSDHLMPGAVGTELARQIKANHPTIPAILLSGMNAIPADAGAVHVCLSKPQRTEWLCEMMAAALAE